MPKSWYDRHVVNKFDDDSKKDFYRSIVADKKPYFMRYIYPSLMKQYNTYISNTNRNALREFQVTVPEMMSAPYESLTDRQREFLRYYGYRMPVGLNNCVMNRICRRFEEEFDGIIKKSKPEMQFDYTILKSGVEYSMSRYYSIRKLYEDYNRQLRNLAIFSKYERVDGTDLKIEIDQLNYEFRKECTKVCPNEETLCDIILDLCYSKSSTKKFAWEMCGKTIIHNLLERNSHKISFPELSESGDIYYCGKAFSEHEIEIPDDNG